MGGLFCLLTAVYVAEFFAAFGMEAAERLLGLVHTVTGLWLRRGAPVDVEGLEPPASRV